MSTRVKHTFSFQEFRRTLFLNLHAKDECGRHRGHVLYGMLVSPVAGANNIVKVGSGALYTALGTRLYWDVATSPETVIDLTTVKIGADPAIEAPAASRPFAIAIVAQVSSNASQVPAIEKPEDAGSASTVRFGARLVSMNRALGQPAQRLLAADPVTLDPYTDGSDELLSHIDTVNTPAPGVSAPADPTLGGAPADDAIQNNEILLGYLLVGSAEDGTLPTSFADTSGHWRAGVAFVPMYNPHEAIADALGFDPLAGRVADFYVRGVGPSQGDRALRQVAEASVVGPDGNTSTTWGHATPAFGTTQPTSDGATAWASTWGTYRWPSFLRDGEPLLWALRRMDYVLRLWMDRTGDQELVRWTQDTALGSNRSFQAPLQQLLRQFDGSATAQSPTAGAAGNGNRVEWGGGAANSDDNHVLIDGIVGHVLAADTPVLPWGDTHLTAIKALDRALWHVLSDILGRTFRKTTDLRSAAAWSLGVTGRQFRDDGPMGLLQGFANWPTCTGACSAAAVYLDEQKIYDAIERICGRVNSGVGGNLLVNPRFMAGRTSAAGVEELSGDQTAAPLGWAFLVGGIGTWARTRISHDAEGWRSSVMLDVNCTSGALGLKQTVPSANEILRRLAEGNSLLSLRATIAVPAGAEPVVLEVNGYNGASAVFGAATQPIGPTTSDATKKFRTVNFTIQLADPAQAITTLEFMVRPASGTATALTFSLLETGINIGFPEAHGRAQEDDFLSRWGGSGSKMLGPLDMGGQLIRNSGEGYLQVGDVKWTARATLGPLAPGEVWNTCDGTQYDSTVETVLFAAIGHNFTPAAEVLSDPTLFRIPDTRFRAMVGVGTGTDATAVAKTIALGEILGEYGHVQTAAELISHTHDVSAASFSVQPVSTATAGTAGGFASQTLLTTTAAGSATPTAMNVVQPVVGMNAFIRVR